MYSLSLSLSLTNTHTHTHTHCLVVLVRFTFHNETLRKAIQGRVYKAVLVGLASGMSPPGHLTCVFPLDRLSKPLSMTR
jgi:hypothetical protein